MRLWVGLIKLAAYLCQSPLIKGRVYFGVRFANCKDACVWPAVRRLVQYLQLSNVKPTRDIIGDTSKGIGNLILWNADSLLEQKLTVSLNCANNIISQLVFAFTGRNRFILMGLWRQFKNSKTNLDANLCLHLSMHIKNISIHLVTQSLLALKWCTCRSWYCLFCHIFDTLS